MRHKDAFLNLSFFIFFSSVIIQSVTLTSDRWVYGEFPALPLGIEMPANASFHTEGGLFHVCIGLDNLSVRGTLEKVRERCVILNVVRTLGIIVSVSI